MRPPFLLFLFLSFFFLFTSWETFAQKAIQGHVKDSKGIPVPLPAIILLDSRDSSLYKAELGDTLGYYRIEVTATAHLLVKVVATGYVSSMISLTDSISLNQSLDFVLHVSDKELIGVTVAAARPLIERRADRTVFNVESSISGIGADVLEVIKKAPGVRVNGEQIGIIGKSSTTVMINDKLVQLSGEELTGLLRSMAADQVLRVEVITAPPAKYDAAGNSGIINIVTKRGHANGLNGNITGRFQQNSLGSVSTNGSFNYRRDRLNIYGNETACRNSIRPRKVYTVYYPGQRWVQTSDERSLFAMGRYQLGADYELTKHSVIGLLYTYGTSKPENDEHIAARAIRDDNGLDSLISTISHTDEDGVRNVMNLNYAWNIDTSGRKLNMDLDYFTRTGRKIRNYTIGSFFDDGTSTGFNSVNRTSGKQVINIRTAKLDLDWPTRLAILSFGGKLSYIHNTSENVASVQDHLVYVNDPTRTFNFDYHENTQALYISAQRTLKKWELQLGLRGEYTQTKGYEPTLKQTNNNRYFKLFPSFYLQFNANDDYTFNFNCNRRIERPSFWLLNPFRYYYTQDSYEEGNPFLQPSFSNNMEFAFTFRSKYSLTLYGQDVQDYFTRVSRVDTLHKALYFTQDNAGKEFNFGAKAEAVLGITSWWECNAGLYGYYNRFSSSFYDTSRQSAQLRPSCYLSASNSFVLNKKRTLFAEINAWYMGRSLGDFDLVESYYSVSCGIKALLLKKKLVISLNGEDLLRSEGTTLTNLYNGTRQSEYSDNRNISCSLTWKFGNNGIKAKRDRKIGMEDEGSRAGG